MKRTEDEIIEDIKNNINEITINRHIVLDMLLGLIFWKDYSVGYVEPKLKDSILDFSSNYTIKGGEDSSYISYDNDKALEIANLVRERINLPKLIMESGVLYEEQDLKKETRKTFKIKRSDFIDWYYSDLDASDRIINSLKKTGEYSLNIDEVWESVGYIPKRLVLNPEITDEWQEDEIEEPSTDYDVEWILNG